MAKIRVRDLTLGQLVEIAKEHKGSCGTCPLFKTHLHCFNYCDASQKQKEQIESMIKGFIDLEEDSLIEID